MNAIQARYIIESKLATLLNVNGLTIRKMSGEDLTLVISNFNQKSISLYKKLLSELPDNAKTSQMYKNELVGMVPIIEHGMVRLAPSSYQPESWNWKN